MREYSKVYPQIWIGKTGKEIKKYGIETQFLTHYLLSSPHATMIGIYYLPLAFIAHETGMSLEVISKALRNLINIDFCSYDENEEYVWVHNMGLFQICKELKLADKRVSNVNSYFMTLPKLEFLSDFYKKYREVFHLNERMDIQSPLQAPSKPRA